MSRNNVENSTKNDTKDGMWNNIGKVVRNDTRDGMGNNIGNDIRNDEIVNPMNRPEERATLEKLDRLMMRDEAAKSIERAIAIASAKLAADSDAMLSWEPIPLGAYGPDLPEMIKSSWVFILRSRSITGAERHPNSHQRMASYRGSGDFQIAFQIDDGHRWQSNYLGSSPGSSLERKWVSIPANTWHQGVTGDEDWVVVSFHTVSDRDLIEERPDSADSAITYSRTYLD